MRRLHALFALVTLATGACAGGAAPRTVRQPAAVVRVTPTPALAPVRPAAPPADQRNPSAGMTHRTWSAPSRTAIRAALAARRAHHLDVLHAYRTAGIFPHNSTQPGEGHFLIDPRGVLCAVANLIAEDGHLLLIETTARIDNGLLFAEVERGEFHDWILSSGFTRDEIGRIQVPAPYVGPVPEPVILPEPGPAPVPEPAPIAVDPFAAADLQVAAYLEAIETTLRAANDASLDLAVAALAARPDLAIAVVREAVPAPDAVATIQFAQPPQ